MCVEGGGGGGGGVNGIARESYLCHSPVCLSCTYILTLLLIVQK